MLARMNESLTSGLNAALATELKGARAAAGMTFDQVAAATTISRSSLIRLEKMRRDITTLDIARLCIAYGMEPTELVRRAQDRLSR